MSLSFHIGDALYPIGTDNKIIAHICNTEGAWGGGFTASLNKRWQKPKIVYRNSKFRVLGTVQFIEVQKDIQVANMIAQVFHKRCGPPIRYFALKKTLDLVAIRARQYGASVHMPRIGTGLAGGKWEEIEKIIQLTLINAGIHVYVYNLSEKN